MRSIEEIEKRINDLNEIIAEKDIPIELFIARRNALEWVLEEPAPKKEIKDTCNHEWIRHGDWGGEGYCKKCRKVKIFDPWFCPNAPEHHCVYTKSNDSCDYCGLPEERK